jgi:hypothetical protein
MTTCADRVGYATTAEYIDRLHLHAGSLVHGNTRYPGWTSPARRRGHGPASDGCAHGSTNIPIRANVRCLLRDEMGGGGNYSAQDMAAIILRHRATIERLIKHRDPPVVAQLNRHELLLRDKDGELRPVKRKR